MVADNCNNVWLDHLEVQIISQEPMTEASINTSFAAQGGRSKVVILQYM